jgi:hypothetical protein
MYERRYDVEFPGIGRVDLDRIMLTIGGAVAVGIGLDMAVSKVTGGWKDNGETNSNKEGKES